MLLLALIYFILAIISWNFTLPLYAAVLIITLQFIPNLFITQYDGWHLDSNQLNIERIPAFKSKETTTIPLKHIHRITYFEGFRRIPNSIEIESNLGKHRLYLNISMFKIAPTLLYLKKQGIKFELNERNAELELYLDEKTDSIPIKNKY